MEEQTAEDGVIYSVAATTVVLKGGRVAAAEFSICSLSFPR